MLKYLPKVSVKYFSIDIFGLIFNHIINFVACPECLLGQILMKIDISKITAVEFQNFLWGKISIHVHHDI